MATSSLPEDAAAVVVDDDDPTYEEDSASSTASLRSSLLESVREFGRGYHKYKAGQFPFPDDELEADRLDFQHHLWRMTLDGKLYLAPLDESKLHHVLDMGTGTGIWAIEFADEHPSAQVIGTDLSPSQPTLRSVPPNCKFEIDDCEEPWTFSQKFDYIHGRVLIAAFKDWPKVFRQVFSGLRPGGWFEMQDILYPPESDDGSLKEDSALYRWGQLMIKGTENGGREITIASKYKQWMIEAGFTDVTEIKLMWPQNQWPDDPKQKELGLWTLVTVLEGLQGFSMAVMTKGLGMSTEEVNLLLMDVRKQIRDKSIHSYWPVYLVYGRKPEQAT